MAWTTPVDYTTGQVISATIWNNLVGASGNIIETAGGKVTTAGDLVYGTGANAVSRLGIGSASNVLKTNTGATAPEWGTIAASELTGWGNDKVVYTGNSGTLTELALGSSGTFLKSNGATSAPSFDTATVASSAITGWGNDKVMYTNNSGSLVELALGASGEFLKSNGATSAPTFAAPAAGGTNGLELLGSHTTEATTTNSFATDLVTITWTSTSKPILIIGRARFSTSHGNGYVDLKATHSGGTVTISDTASPGLVFAATSSYAQQGGNFVTILWTNLPSGNDANYQVAGNDVWSVNARGPSYGWGTFGTNTPGARPANSFPSNAIEGITLTGYSSSSGTTAINDVYVYSFATS